MAHDTSAGTWPERKASLNRCRRQAGQHSRLIGPGVCRVALLRRRRQTPPSQQPLESPCDDGDDVPHVVTRESASGMKAQRVVVVRKHPIENRMEVDIQIQGASEALNDDDRPTAAVCDAVAAALDGEPGTRAFKRFARGGWNHEVVNRYAYIQLKKVGGGGTANSEEIRRKVPDNREATGGPVPPPSSPRLRRGKRLTGAPACRTRVGGRSKEGHFRIWSVFGR